MHGRMYDPVLGQFLSPDPVMQMPFSQGFNRFAYTFNNPLSYVDPSGFEASPTTIGIDVRIGAAYGTGLALTLAGGSSVGAGAGVSAGAGAAAVGTGAGVANALGAGTGAASGIAVVANIALLTSLQPVHTAAQNVDVASRAANMNGQGTPPMGRTSAAMGTSPVTEGFPGSVQEYLQQGGIEEAAIPVCGSSAPKGAACLPAGTSALDFIPGGEGVVVEEAEVVAKTALPWLMRFFRSLIGQEAGGASSRALGRALEAAGHVRAPGEVAHHIVAGAAARAAPARAVLQRFGIGINEASNGVFLRAGAHAGVHTKAYFAAINDMLGQAATRQEALEVLDMIRNALLNGGFP